LSSRTVVDLLVGEEMSNPDAAFGAWAGLACAGPGAGEAALGPLVP